MENLVELVKNAGIVGAGGAGFPTHVKIDANADTVIINGAECEPLLRVDQQLMDIRAEDLLKGLTAVMEHVGAKQGIIGLKKKYTSAIDSLNKLLPKYPNIRLEILENFYPAGDEQTLVYEATGRIVPEGGLPLNVGVVVMNVESVLQIEDALTEEKPVIDKYITITGAVKNPISTVVPLGITAREAIELAGGPMVDEFEIINGGPMMGKIVSPDSYVTKTTKGFIVLPKDHQVIESKNRPVERSMRDAAIACMQCSLCTEVCPRHRLGHDLEPHKLMRICAYGNTLDAESSPTNAFLCVDCGLCQYACVHDLQPWKVNRTIKGELGKAGIKNPHHKAPEEAIRFADTHRFNVHRLISRLGLDQFDVPAPMVDNPNTYDEVSIELHQNVGAPAKPVVEVGQQVKRGELIADIPEGALGAKIFSSIDGTVTAIENGAITIAA